MRANRTTEIFMEPILLAGYPLGSSLGLGAAFHAGDAIGLR